MKKNKFMMDESKIIESIKKQWKGAAEKELSSLKEIQKKLKSVYVKSAIRSIKLTINGDEIEPFDIGSLNSLYWKIKFPETNAERTIHWFMYGKRFLLPPQHFNCKCSKVIIQSKDELK